MKLTSRYVWTNHLSKNNKWCALCEDKKIKRQQHNNQNFKCLYSTCWTRVVPCTQKKSVTLVFKCKYKSSYRPTSSNVHQIIPNKFVVYIDVFAFTFPSPNRKPILGTLSQCLLPPPWWLLPPLDSPLVIYEQLTIRGIFLLFLAYNVKVIYGQLTTHGIFSSLLLNPYFIRG